MRQRQFNRVRFAPSPNGYLHVGHAYSALLNWQIANNIGADFLLRIEDIDLGRTRPEFTEMIFDDLKWLGLSWPEPVLYQSTRFKAYQEALTQLIDKELVYPSFLTRKQVRDIVRDFEQNGKIWPRDPDGAPLYPRACKALSQSAREQRIDEAVPYSWRLDMEKVQNIIGSDVSWTEMDLDFNRKEVTAPLSGWGDVVLARKDVPTSYHLSVVLDDGFQNVDFIIRGQDIYHATSIHRALQNLLDLPEPTYLHHDLILDEGQQKLSKSLKSKSIKELRENEGVTASDMKVMLGLCLS